MLHKLEKDMSVWSLKDLDTSKAIEDIPSQNPQTSLRFNLPIPNWLDENGRPKLAHAQICRKNDGSWRFFFQNYKDNCLQGVRIEGSSVITFMGPNPETSQKLIQIIQEYSADLEQLTPVQISDILERARVELGLQDMYNNDRKGVELHMHPYAEITTNHKYFGPFLPNPMISTAIYIHDSGSFSDGPMVTPQRFENGAFISFQDSGKKRFLRCRRKKYWLVKIFQ